MIATLEDARRYTAELARTVPTLAREIELCAPGLSAVELMELRRELVRLPDTYLDVIGAINVRSISVGFFQLSPRRLREGERFLDVLKRVNDATNPISGLLVSASLIQVAAYEGDPLCVSGRGSAREGSIYRISYSDPIDPRQIASSFSQLIVLACRLDEARRAGEVGDAAVARFLSSLPSMELDHEALDQWRLFASVALKQD